MLRWGMLLGSVFTSVAAAVPQAQWFKTYGCVESIDKVSIAQQEPWGVDALPWEPDATKTLVLQVDATLEGYEPGFAANISSRVVGDPDRFQKDVTWNLELGGIFAEGNRSMLGMPVAIFEHEPIKFLIPVTDGGLNKFTSMERLLTVRFPGCYDRNTQTTSDLLVQVKHLQSKNQATLLPVGKVLRQP
ncbi:hypothetical protein K2X33_11620 [bacterium]|nr:hypothetical protein [bacterium]